jgi:serine/threonine protein kinase
MRPERWRQIEEVFEAAARLAGAERECYLDSACGADRELREEVESLLALDGQAPEFLNAGIRRQAEQLSSDVARTFLGCRIGPYRVTKLLGRGGMGAVYLAVREDEVYDRPVALKLIKRGMDTEEVVHRFHQERRILSRLDHPHIARLLDGGTTDDGLPYFVMEHVEGVVLTEHARTLSVRERLLLFRQVCAAVEYAHRNLIVHRDLKPGNILVTTEGTPKLLDFGIAKLLESDDATQTYGVRILTPDYASPEQKRGEAVTTATDVYSLGRVLQELLRGETSPGDLASIVELALWEEPERRYGSVTQLSEDIRRHLEGLPVIARKDTVFYRARKFVRRNRWGVAAAALAALSLAVGGGVAAVQARRAEQRLEQVRGFASLLMGEIGQLLTRTRGTIAARQELLPGVLQSLDLLSKEAPQERSLQILIARAHVRVGLLQYAPHQNQLMQIEASLDSAQKARAILEPLFEEDPSNTEVKAVLGTAHMCIGYALYGLGDFSGALEWHRKALPLVRPADRWAVSVWTANDLMELGRFREALEHLEPIAVTTERVHSAVGAGWVPQARRAVALIGIGDLHQADAIARPFIAKYHGVVRLRLGNLSGNPLVLNLGDTKAGLRDVREALRLAEEHAATDPDDIAAREGVATAHASLGAFLRETEPQQSVDLYLKVIPVQDLLLQKSPRNWFARRTLGRAHAELALPLRKLGRPHEAKMHLARADEIERALGQPQSFTAGEQGDLALASGDRAGALVHYKIALDRAEKAVAARPEDMQLWRELADCHERLGEFHARAGEWRQARDWYAQSFSVWKDWTRWGVSSVYNLRREKQAAASLARCDAALARLKRNKP